MQYFFLKNWQSPLPFAIHVSNTNNNHVQLTLNKEQAILISAKRNYKCRKEIRALDCRRFSVSFLNAIPFKIFLIKMKNIGKFGLKYYWHIVWPLVLCILKLSF